MDATDRLLKRLIWLYFFLLIFEGALRKWIVPSLSTPLLIVRDPVVLMIYIMAAGRGRFPVNSFVGVTVLLAILSALASFTSIGNLKVTFFGLRANFLHLPLVFVLPAVLDIEDVKRIGKWFLIFLPAMAVISMQQFRSPSESWWNAGAGGEVGGQLGTARNKVRASGTFSFVNGLVSYLSVSASFILYHFMQKHVYNHVLGWLAIGGALLTLAVGGSRSAVVSVVVVCTAVVWICLRQPARFGKALRPAIWGYLAVLLLTYILPEFSEGIAVQRDRFIGGGGLKEGIFMRYFAEFPAAIRMAFNVPFFGYGLGVGTNAGAGLLVGVRTFLLAESEWGRVVMESGPLLGFGYIGLRIGITVYVLLNASRALARGNIFPVLLAGAGFLDMLTGQFGQPTALGFAVFTCGLSLAACRLPQDQLAQEEVATPQPHGIAKVPGRSPYARRLHGEGGE